MKRSYNNTALIVLLLTLAVASSGCGTTNNDDSTAQRAGWNVFGPSNFPNSFFAPDSGAFPINSSFLFECTLPEFCDTNGIFSSIDDYEDESDQE